MSTIDVFSKIFAVYSLLLIVASIILNPLILFICLRSKTLRSNSTFKLLAFNSVNDILVSLVWNSEAFVFTFFTNLPFYYGSLIYCRFMSTFFQNATLALSTWLLSSISFDRLLSMLISRWTKFYFSGSRPIIYSALLTLIIVLANFDEIFTMGYIYIDQNGTETVICYATSPDSSVDWYLINSAAALTLAATALAAFLAFACAFFSSSLVLSHWSAKV